MSLVDGNTGAVPQASLDQIEDILDNTNTIDGKIDANTSEINTIDTKVDNLELHNHPPLSIATPNGSSRFAAVQFTNIANTNNFVLGTITYTFLNTLGTPGANNVHVKIQGTLADTVKVLANAIRGLTDATNIVYGTGTSSNTTAIGWYTSVRVSADTNTLTAGANIVLNEIARDVTTAITLTSTATTTILPFVRIFSNRYALNNNSLNITSDTQIAIPIGAIPYEYDLIALIIEGNSTDTTRKEVDILTSTDEVTFTTLIRGLTISFTEATRGSLPIYIQTSEMMTGAGLYIRARSSGVLNNETFDYKIAYHVYI